MHEHELPAEVDQIIKSTARWVRRHAPFTEYEVLCQAGALAYLELTHAPRWSELCDLPAEKRAGKIRSAVRTGMFDDVELKKDFTRSVHSTRLRHIDAEMLRCRADGLPEPSLAQLVKKLGYSEKMIKKTLRWAGRIQFESLDALKQPPAAAEPDPRSLALARSFLSEWAKKMHRLLVEQVIPDAAAASSSKRRQFDVLTTWLHHTLDRVLKEQVEPMTNEALGKKFSISADSAKQDKTRALKCIEDHLRQLLADAGAPGAAPAIITAVRFLPDTLSKPAALSDEDLCQLDAARNKLQSPPWLKQLIQLAIEPQKLWETRHDGR